MFFFWALFDGTVSYLSPILITQKGYSDAMMGLLISLSSVAGAFFDVLMGRYLREPRWRLVFLLMLAASAATIVVLWASSTILIFVLAMALWALYFNFNNFGLYDFVSANAPTQQRGREYGIINIFKFLGYILAPLFLGFLIADKVTGSSLVFGICALAGSLLFFLLLLRLTQGSLLRPERSKRSNVRKALHSISRDGFLLLPVFLFTVVYNASEAFFWTLGPLLSIEFASLHPLDGLFVTAYFMPMLLTGWFVGPITRRFGKKRSALFSFAIGSSILLLFFVVRDPYLLIALTFVASLFITFSLPCISAAYADYISEDRRDQGHIEAMGDFSANVGYIIGPLLAGILAGLFGTVSTFGILGACALVLTLLLMRVMPRHINLAPR